MKSERRHELQHNDLAEWMIGAYERVKPYQNAILGSLILVAVGVIVASWWRSDAKAKAVQATNALFAAASTPTPAALDQVAEQHPGTSIAQWAKVNAADSYLVTGAEMLFQNKALASENLNKATERYEEVLQQASSPMLKERATFGLARTWEAKGANAKTGEELDSAKKLYRQMVEKWPNGAFKSVAEQRLKDLERNSTRELYAQFTKYEPETAAKEPAPGSKKSFSDPSDNPELLQLLDGKKDTADKDAKTKDASPKESPLLEPSAKEPGAKDAPKPSSAEKEKSPPADTGKGPETKPADPKSAEPKPAEKSPAKEDAAEKK